MTEAPRVLLAMPRYGDVSAGAAEAFYCPTEGAVSVQLANGANSLTPNAFNDLWAIAMDLRDAGDVTHFAMIHSDIEPDGPWLDLLWSEMCHGGFDVVSAVVPIKEDAADLATSTAVGVADDPWGPRRRLNLSDRARLPLTFTGADVCGPGEVLLVNTGLWLADLRHPAWDAFPGFQVVTRVIKTTEGRRAQCRPEDWEMSRHLHEHGAKVAATWRVRLGHAGAKRWKNY